MARKTSEARIWKKGGGLDLEREKAASESAKRTSGTGKTRK
jgi:hypothetical protein